MPVMVVVNVAVLVLDWLMHVFVAVPFRQVQEEPERHQAAGNGQRPGDGFGE
jgi:hypothetical protein